MHQLIIKKLLENKNYYKYLKENSEWIKVLKRNPNRYKDFVSYIKKKYHLRPQDKVKNTLDKAEVLSEVLSSLK